MFLVTKTGLEFHLNSHREHKSHEKVFWGTSAWEMAKIEKKILCKVSQINHVCI